MFNIFINIGHRVYRNWLGTNENYSRGNGEIGPTHQHTEWQEKSCSNENTSQKPYRNAVSLNEK